MESAGQPVKTGIAYCRTSTIAQREAETITAQTERCRRLIATHNVTLLSYGPSKDGWVSDDGVSGSLLDGRAFAKLLEDIEAGTIRPDYLVVYSLSRIARIDRTSKKMDKLQASHLAAARIQAVLIGCGVQVLEEEGPIDAASLNYGLKTLLASEEYKLIRGRTMAGKSRRLRENRYAKGGHPPYGYRQVFANGADRRHGFTLEVDPEAGPRLSQLLAWYCEGGVTHAARKATESGYPTPMADTTNRRNAAKDWTPTRWSPVSLMHIVRNVRAYLGETNLVFDGQAHSITYPALISTETYAAVERQRRTYVLKRRTTFLTTGFVDCICGEHLHERNSHDKHYARCPAGCGSMHQREFESALWAIVVCRLVQIQQHERLVMGTEDPFGPQVKAAKGRLEQARAEIGKLVDLYLADQIDKAILTERNVELDRRKLLAQAELDQLTRQREEHKSKRAGEQSIEKRVSALLQEFMRETPSLERKRAVLGDLLQGERAIIAYGKRRKGLAKNGAAMSPFVKITQPAFGDLPPLTMQSDKYLWEQLDGVVDDGTLEQI